MFPKRIAIFITLQKNEKIFLFCIIRVSLSVFFFTKYYIRGENQISYFYLLVVLFIISILILIVRNNVFILFIGWDGLGVTSFFLVGFYQNWKTCNNRLLTFFRNRAGDGFLIILFSFILFLNIRLQSYSYLFYSIFVLILLTRITKRAQFPISRWLPAAMAAPTPVSALVHSSTLVTAGILLLIKIFFFRKTFNNQLFCFYIGLLTILVAGLTAIKEKDFKKLVALSTLRQIGFLVFILGIGFFWLSLFHLIIHAFFKRLLFFSVGSVLHYSISLQDHRKYKNTNIFSYLTIFLLQVTLICLIGLFFFSGFFSKDIFLEIRIFPSWKNIIIVIIYILTISLTLFYRSVILLKTINRSRRFLYKYEQSEQFFISVILLFMLRVTMGLFFRANLQNFTEPFIFSEKNTPWYFFVLLFSLFLLFSFFYLKLETFFYLNVLWSSFSNNFQIKKCNRTERAILEKLNFFLINFFTFRKISISFLKKTKTLLILLLFLLILLLFLVFRIKSL